MLVTNGDCALKIKKVINRRQIQTANKQEEMMLWEMMMEI